MPHQFLPFRKTPSSRRNERRRGKVGSYIFRGDRSNYTRRVTKIHTLSARTAHGGKVTREFGRKEWRMHRSFHELTSGIPVRRAAGFEIRSHASVERNAVVLRSARRWRYHHAANLKFPRINSAATAFIYLLSNAFDRISNRKINLTCCCCLLLF